MAGLGVKPAHTVVIKEKCTEMVVATVAARPISPTRREGAKRLKNTMKKPRVLLPLEPQLQGVLLRGVQPSNVKQQSRKNRNRISLISETNLQSQQQPTKHQLLQMHSLI